MAPASLPAGSPGVPRGVATEATLAGRPLAFPGSKMASVLGVPPELELNKRGVNSTEIGKLKVYAYCTCCSRLFRSSHVIRSILRIDRPTEGDNGAYQCKYRLLPPAPSSYKQQVQRRQLKDQQGRHLQGILAPRHRRRKLASDKVVVASTFPPRAVRRK